MPGGRSRERGAAAVEAAVVTPVVLLLMLSILEFGLFFKNYLSVSASTKAGVRTASANPRVASFAQDAADQVQAASGALDRSSIQELWVYKANPGDNFPIGFGSFANCSVCVKFRWSGTSFVPTSSTWAGTDQNACITSPPDRIGVYIKYRHTPASQFVIRTISFSQADVLRLEPIPERSGCTP